MNIWKGLRSQSLPPIFTWEYGVGALLLATVLARGVAALYDAWVPQKYTQLLVGNLAWDGGSKQPDYIILFGFVGFFFAIHLGLRFLAARIQTVNGELAESGFRDILVYTLLPTGVWIGNIFVNSKPTLDLVILSSVLALLAIAGAVGLVARGYSFTSTAAYRACIGSSLLILLFAGLSGNALMLAIARLNLNWQFTDTQVILASVAVLLILGAVLLSVWVWRKASLWALQQRLRSLLGVSQWLLPLSFFILLPAPWLDGQQRFYGYAISPVLYGLIGVLIGISYLDIGRRSRQRSLKDEAIDVFSVVSPLCCIALLVYLKSPVVGVSFIPPDDYHWGEFLLPWWLLKTFGYIPFWDYEPARGMINYVPGFLSSLLFNDTAGSYLAVAARAPQHLPYLAIAFLAISRSIGALPTFLALALVPNPNNLYEIDLMITAGLCILAEFFLQKRPVRWLGLWLLTGILLILFAPGQGGLFTIATFPLAAFVGYQAIRWQRPWLMRGAIAAIAGALLLALLTPLDQMLWGALRYGLEQSSLNSVAYGAEWVKSTGSNPFQTYPLWEFFRTSWIVVTVAIGLLVYQIVSQPKTPERQRFLVFAIPLFLLTLLIIPRAAGRIDAGTFSRLGVTSAWTMCLVLPTILLTRFGDRARSLIFLLVAILGSLLTSGMEETLPNLERLVQHPVQTINVTGTSFVSGTQTGLPMLEGAVLDPEHLQRLQRLKAIIQTVLEPGETYLDLTNRNARYFHLNYPPPMPAAAYNLIHTNQQQRTIAQVKSQPVPLVIAVADGYTEYYSLALRTPLLYRYAVENYIPFKIDEFILMIQPDRRDRLNRWFGSNVDQPPNLVVGDTAPLQLALLDQAFRVNDLKQIPTSWGRSQRSLQSVMQPVQTLADATVRLQDLKELASDRYQVTGAAPRLTFNLPKSNLNGWNAELLQFDFTCHHRSKGAFAIRWNSQSSDSPENIIRFTPRNGTQIVPLDAAPRWLLAKGIQTLSVEPLDNICTDFSLSQMSLYQRQSLPDKQSPEKPAAHQGRIGQEAARDSGQSGQWDRPLAPLSLASHMH